MKKISWVFFIAFVATLVGAQACKKTQNLESDSSNDISNSTNCSTPSVREGRLCFSSEQHLKDYYIYLSNTLMGCNQEDCTDPDSVLFEIENRLGYTSIRSLINKEYIDDSARDGEEPEESWMETDWLKDDIRKSILNQHYEVSIDGMVYIYFSENQIYKFPENNISLIEEIRSMEKGDDSKVQTTIVNNAGVELISNKFEKIYSAAMPPNNNCSLAPNVYAQGSDCMPLWKHVTGDFYITSSITDFEGNTFYTTENISATFTFNWGDGTETIIENSTAFDISHTYTAAGFYQTSLTILYNDPCDYESLTSITYQGLVSDGIFEIHDQVCAGETENSNIDNTQTSGDYRMYSELWFRNDIFGTHEGAKTVSYEHRWIVGLGTAWWRTRAYVKAEINWHFRNGNCNNININGLNNGIETDWCDNCKWKRANKTCTSDGNIHYADEEVHSLHYVDNNGHTFSDQLTLQVCE